MCEARSKSVKTIFRRVHRSDNQKDAGTRELNRKEKALAETAALLVLSKKWEAIWGENEED